MPRYNKKKDNKPAKNTLLSSSSSSSSFSSPSKGSGGTLNNIVGEEPSITLRRSSSSKRQPTDNIIHQQPDIHVVTSLPPSKVTVGGSKAAKKTYACLLCPKSFNRPSALETHSYTHTAEKPFQCHSPGCGKYFSVASNLRRHLKIHQRK